MKENRVFVIDAKRSAIGKFLGSLYEMDPTEVSKQVIQNGFAHYNLNDVESVIIGNVIGAGTGQGLARKIAINSGIPITTPAYSVNMVCGSGMQALINGFKEIKCGKAVVLTGGVEFMSKIPFATNSYIRFGKKFGDFTMTDLMTHDGLIDSFSGVHMGVTAENIAKEYSISREMQDEYSYLTQQRAIYAVDNKKFKNEIVPVVLKDYRKNEYVFETDEFPNRKSSKEKLATLKPTFLRDGSGTVTAGNTSGINDGVSFILLASEDYCKENHIIPLVELCEGTAVGCDPQLMGLGPYYAITDLLNKCDMKLDDIDCLEINEAFAAQALGCYKLLANKYNTTIEKIVNKTNLKGSVGSTGARIVGTLSHTMKELGSEYGVASLCIGGGMGAAVLVRKVDENEFA